MNIQIYTFIYIENILINVQQLIGTDDISIITENDGV